MILIFSEENSKLVEIYDIISGEKVENSLRVSSLKYWVLIKTGKIVNTIIAERIKLIIIVYLT